MIEFSTGYVDQVAVAPPLAPIEQTIDIAHLARMTLGEPSLEREVLQLFDRQADMLLGRMRETAPAVVAACAHTLKGSSRGIGAWQVAHAAEAVELAAASADTAEVKKAIEHLRGSVDEARLVIADMLRPH
jgi:HPt (histidine-containing phosphotransfer) domain-containing protein